MGTTKPTPRLLEMVTEPVQRDLVIQLSTSKKGTEPIWTSEISPYLLLRSSQALVI